MRRVLIVGRAGGVLQEYASARAIGVFDDVVVIGKMGELFPDQIDYWCSFHANLFDRWAEVRQRRGFPPAVHYWGAFYGKKKIGEQTRCAPISFVRNAGGSSGFLAVTGALEVLQADRVVLAGIPMSAEAGHEPEASEPLEVGRKWGEAGVYWSTWEQHADRLLGKVKSMSGRTRTLLGAPTQEWLGG